MFHLDFLDIKKFWLYWKKLDLSTYQVRAVGGDEVIDGVGGLAVHAPHHTCN